MDAEATAWLVKWRLLGAPTTLEDGKFFAAIPEQAFDILEEEEDPRYVTYFTGPEVHWAVDKPGTIQPPLCTLRRGKETRRYELSLWSFDPYLAGAVAGDPVTPVPRIAASPHLKEVLVPTLHYLWRGLETSHEDLREKIREALLVAEARDA